MFRSKKSAKATSASRRKNTPGNLLDLNRTLPNYAYHPKGVGSGRPTGQATPMPKQRRPWKKILLWTLAVIIFIAVLTGGWVGWKLVANQVRIFGWGSLFSLFTKTELKGENGGHVNILLAGNSSDDVGHTGGNLTDSIMVFSLNTQNNTAFMLSIPRDLYVDIPGNGYAKINEAYQDGEQDGFRESGYATGGMGLLQKTIAENFDIPMHYYALVDYGAVRQAVDAVGGISVVIDSDDPDGLYDPSPDYQNNGKPLVDLPNGRSTLNGAQALGLVRARGHAYGAYGFGQSDFTRTKNQRAVLLALKDKATSAGTLSNPIKLGELFDSLGDNVTTDLTLGEARRLYNLVQKVPNSKIASVGLNDAEGQYLLASYTNDYGQSTLIPRQGIDDYSEIQTYVHKLLNPPAPAPKN